MHTPVIDVAAHMSFLTSSLTLYLKLKMISYAAKDKDTAYFCRQFKQFSFTTRVTGLASTSLPILNRQNEGKTFQDKSMNIF
jgi:hypothetical protein